MTARERSYRGISARAAIGYLERLGGERADKGADEQVDEGTSDGRVEGEGWVAQVSEEDVRIGRSITLSEVTVRFEGDEATLDPLIESFSQKAIRAGG